MPTSFPPPPTHPQSLVLSEKSSDTFTQDSTSRVQFPREFPRQCGLLSWKDSSIRSSRWRKGKGGPVIIAQRQAKEKYGKEMFLN